VKGSLAKGYSIIKVMNVEELMRISEYNIPFPFHLLPIPGDDLPDKSQMPMQW
jgi:predicted amino acid racemase